MKSERSSSKVNEIFESMKYAANNKRPLDTDAGGSIIVGEKLSPGNALAGRFKTMFVNDRDIAIRAAKMQKMIEESMSILPLDRPSCEKLIEERVPSLGKLSYISTAIGDDPSTEDADSQPSEPLSIEFPPGNEERVLEHLHRICGNDPIIIATVSKMIGQRALAPLVIALATDFAPRNPSEAPPVLKMRDIDPPKDPQENTTDKETKEKLHLVYSIEQTGDGRLLVGAEYGSKGEEYVDAFGRKIWAINRSSRWKGPPSAQNVALFGTYCLSVNLSDLSEGRIRPTFVKLAEGGYRIEPYLPPLSPLT